MCDSVYVNLQTFLHTMCANARQMILANSYGHKHTYLLLLISMLWHRQAIFESKGDKLYSSAECRIQTHQGLRHQIASRLNARWQTDWAIEDQAKKNLNSTARPYDQRAFSPLEPTAVWHSHLALAIYIFVVVNVRKYYVHTTMYIHTYIFIRGFALAQGTFSLVIFAWICCDGFESQLRNGYLLKCDCLFDCNWHIATIKWETKIDILGWRDRGSNPRPRVTGRCLIHYTTSDSVTTMVSQELYLPLTPNLRILRKKSYKGYNRHRDIHEIRPALSLKDRLWTSFSVRCLQYIPRKMVRCENWDRD